MIGQPFWKMLYPVLLLAWCVPAAAQEDVGGLIKHLQKEPMSLFDAGMKSLRRLALDTTSFIQTSTKTRATSSVRYSPVSQQIEITLNMQTKLDLGSDGLREKCIEQRKAAIVKMFRVGLSDLRGTSEDAVALSTPERIRRRLGAQFAHEPTDSYRTFQVLGDRLAPSTFFTLRLSTIAEPVVQVTCRGKVTETLSNTVPGADAK